MKFNYKPFDNKFVVIRRDEEGASIAFFTVDQRNNRIPMFYDTAADAVIAIGENMIRIAEAVKKGDIDSSNLNEGFSHFVASASLDKEKHLLVTIMNDENNPWGGEEEIVYDDNIINLN